MLTVERAEQLVKYLNEDQERATELMNMPADEAVVKINADGYDFTVEEIVAFGQELQSVMKAANEDGELDADALDNVSGGLVISGTVAAALIGGGITMFCAGVTFGYQVARDRGW